MTWAGLHHLSTAQIDRYINEIDEALEHHIQWMIRINRALIFGESIHADELSEQPHLLCHFGRWYQREEGSSLCSSPGFDAIGTVHAQLHALARELLRQKQVSSPSSATYDEWTKVGDELRSLFQGLRNCLRSDLGLTSRLMAQVFESAAEGVIITAPDGTVLTVNRAFTKMTGYAAQEVLGKKPNILRSSLQDQLFFEEMWGKLIHEGRWQGEIWNRRKNGENYLEWLTIEAVRNSSGEVTNYVAMFSDITAERQNEERLYRLAHYDPLTNLPNRVLFQDRFDQSLARAQRGDRYMALMFLDLDGFKEVNDRFGHSAGDLLLQQVGKRLREGLRKSDTVARLGGDEFCILLPDLYETGGLAGLAQKVIESIAEPFTITDGQPIFITTSIGISIYPSDGEDADQLLRHADLAMYAAKQKGKNQFCFFGPSLE